MKRLLKVLVSLAVVYIGYVLTGASFVPTEVPEYINRNYKDVIMEVDSSKFDVEPSTAPGRSGIILRQNPAPRTHVWFRHKLLLEYGSDDPAPKTPAIATVVDGQNVPSALSPEVITLPVGQRIAIRLPSELVVESVPLASPFHAELVEPIVRGNTLIAASGAPVMLDAVSEIGEERTTLALRVHKVLSKDGRFVELSTGEQSFAKQVGAESRKNYMFSAVAIGLVVGLIVDAALVFLSMGAFLVIGAIVGLIAGVSSYSQHVHEELVLRVPARTTLEFSLNAPATAEVLVPTRSLK